ncbi:MAG TPA: RNA-binding S4 domain-containing protein [Tissierellia bacterium]|jgi:ribosome-associated protein|nr:RNA-binding S4 domain-containing protein [Tissierellia bacterium]
MKVTIETEYIALDALLKFADILPSGGLTKILLEEGSVLVNGEPVRARRKKIFPGDKVFITWPSEELMVHLDVERER